MDGRESFHAGLGVGRDVEVRGQWRVCAGWQEPAWRAHAMAGKWDRAGTGTGTAVVVKKGGLALRALRPD